MLKIRKATVLLAVNVSYLAAPDVSDSPGTVTAGTVSSLCSTITSIGCIIIGLLLVNEDRSDPKTPSKVCSLFRVKNTRE